MPNSRLAVVTTMRADFLEPCLQYKSLTELIQIQAVYMPPLVGANLEQAILKPAEKQGYHFQDGLLAEIREDVGREQGCLPLLQFALTELWEKRDRQQHQLPLEQYQAIGGVIGALDRHAEQVYCYKDYYKKPPKQEREEREKEWIKRIFLKLVRTGEGVKDTRQRQPKSRLLVIAGDNPDECKALNNVLDRLVQGRLLVTGEKPEEQTETALADLAQESSMIDLAHEALMEGWQRFAEWRKENRQLRRLIDRVEDALREWRKSPQNDNLMMGGLLAQVRDKWQKLEPDLDAAARKFYQRSDAHEQDRIATLEQLLTESRLREQAAKVLNLLPFQPLESLVLAVQSMGKNLDKLPDQILSPVQSCLHTAMEITVSIPCQEHESHVNSVAFSPDGQMIVSGGDDKTVRLWDLQGNPISQPFQGHEDYVISVAFSPDGQMIVSSGGDRTVRLWDLQGNPISQPFQGHENYVSSVAFSPNGRMIVSGGDDKTVRLWAIQGNLINFQRHEDFVNSVAFSPNGQMIVSGGGDETVCLWDLKGNPISPPFQGHKSAVTSVAFSPDGQTIVSGSGDNTVRLWRGCWRAWLQVCCDRLRYYSVFKNPETEAAKAACETCQKYVWNVTTESE